MNTCKVCHTQYPDSTHICPACGYEPVDFYVGSAVTEEESVEKFRRELIDKLEFVFTLYTHHAEGDYVVPDEVPKRAAVSFAENGAVSWIQDSLCALADVKKIEVPVSVVLSGKVIREEAVTMKTLPQRELLQLGVELLKDTMQFRIHMKNDSEETVSAAVPVFRA